MNLYKDGLIELDYDVSADILKVRWPNTKGSSMAELQYSIDKLLSYIRHYDIRKLFIDARENVASVSDEEYMAMNSRFAKDLLSTRLVKIARIGSADVKREKITRKIAEEQLKETDQVMFREFDEESSAMEWLRRS